MYVFNLASKPLLWAAYILMLLIVLMGSQTLAALGQQARLMYDASNDELEESFPTTSDEQAQQALWIQSMIQRQLEAPLSEAQRQTRATYENNENNDERDLHGMREASLLNAHLPATGLFGVGPPSNDEQDDRVFSPPVNEPLWWDHDADDEAELGELTGRLNAEFPNSANRTRALLQLARQRQLDERRQQASEQHEAAERLRHLMSYMYETMQSNIEQQQQRQRDNELQTSTPDTGRIGAVEYIDHPLALAGHQYVQGGAGEGRQLLGPDGTFENVQVVKSDSAVPSYCDPPNPCPLGYAARDGCLEHFVNSASFSREYQAKQQCSCDNEHSLFNCAAPPQQSKTSQLISDEPALASGRAPQEASTNDQEEANGTLVEAKLNTLARALQSRFGDLASVQRLVQMHEQEMNEANNARNNANEHDFLVRSTRKWLQPISALGGQDPKASMLHELD